MARQEQIYTIPVNDAFGQSDHCPLCELEKVQTAILLDFYMGPSLMEADHRKVTNEKGFCHVHLSSMYESQKNRLGLALMLHTHLQELSSDLKQTFSELSVPAKRKLFEAKKEDWKTRMAAKAKRLRKRADSCVICERLAETMERYYEVIFWLWQSDEAFRNKIASGSGFCLGHTADLLERMPRYLKEDQASAMVSLLADKQGRVFTELTDDVEWFTLKFDYRNQDKPWKNSKDALPRALWRLEGLK